MRERTIFVPLTSIRRTLILNTGARQISLLSWPLNVAMRMRFGMAIDKQMQQLLKCKRMDSIGLHFDFFKLGIFTKRERAWRLHFGLRQAHAQGDGRRAHPPAGAGPLGSAVGTCGSRTMVFWLSPAGRPGKGCW